MKKTRDIKKSKITIDMTPMVDVIMLLLTFFMLTATFKAAESEVIEVALPQTLYTDTNKVPDRDVMTFSITDKGDVFLDVDNYVIRRNVFGKDVADPERAPFAIGLYHPDSTNKTESYEATGKVGDKEVTRPIKYYDKAGFEEAIRQLKRELRNFYNNDKAQYKVIVKADKDTDYGVIEDLMVSFNETNTKVFSLVTLIKHEKKQE